MQQLAKEYTESIAVYDKNHDELEKAVVDKVKETCKGLHARLDAADIYLSNSNDGECRIRYNKENGVWEVVRFSADALLCHEIFTVTAWLIDELNTREQKDKPCT